MMLSLDRNRVGYVSLSQNGTGVCIKQDIEKRETVRGYTSRNMVYCRILISNHQYSVVPTVLSRDALKDRPLWSGKIFATRLP
jgi:hypothetical protein